LDVGEYSNVIENDSSFSILYLEQIKQPRQMSFEEVREQIVNDIRQSDAPVYAREAANSFFRQFRNLPPSEEKTFEDFAKGFDYKVTSSEVFYSQGRAPAEAPPELTDRVINLTENELSSVSIGGNHYVVKVNSIREPASPEFDEIRRQSQESL
jgi:parvulin-like peptidyl-prolyl isomerase